MSPEDQRILRLATRHPPAGSIFRVEDPILDEDGRVVCGGMWPSQRKWWNSKHFVRLFVGGYGAGKTINLCKRHIALALDHNGPPTAIVSPTYSVAKETVLVTLCELLDAMAPIWRYWGGDLKYSWTKGSPAEFKIHMVRPLPNGRRVVRNGRILVYTGENPERLKGPNLGSAGIDEPFIQAYAVFEQMVARVRHPLARHKEINLTGTPEQLNWGYDLAEGELNDKHDVDVIVSSTLENKALGPEFVERLLAMMTAEQAEAYVHGHFLNLLEGLVYYGFDRRENVIAIDKPPHAQLGVGMDFNVDPMAAAVFWHTDEHIHYTEEIELRNSDTQEMCQVLREKYWAVGLRNVYPDSNAGRSTSAPGGKTDYDIIADAGFTVHRNNQNPTQRDRHNTVNGMLKPASGRRRMTFDPSCKKLIKYQMQYSHADKNKKPMKGMGHLLDARDYPAWYLFPMVKPDTQVGIRGV